MELEVVRDPRTGEGQGMVVEANLQRMTTMERVTMKMMKMNPQTLGKKRRIMTTLLLVNGM